MISPLMLVVNRCIPFAWKQPLVVCCSSQQLPHVSWGVAAHSSFQISQAPPDLLVSCMDSGLQWAPQIFCWIQVWALCRPVKDVHFAHLEVVLHQKWGMLWVFIMLEDKTSTQPKFCCRLPEVVFQNLLVVMIAFFLIPLSLTRFPVPNALKHPHSIILPHLHISLWERCSLCWAIYLLSPNIGNISVAKEL